MILTLKTGLRSDTPSDLITIDRDYLDRVTSRRALIVAHPSTVMGTTPRGENAVRELYAYLLRDYLPVRYPSIFKLSTALHPDGTSHTTFVNTVTDLEAPVFPIPEDPLEAIRILGETVEEDFFLLLPREKYSDEGGGEHEAVAFLCCHPSGFDPSKLLGKVLKDIHGPVPAYEKIGPCMERYFGHLGAGKNVKRMNVSNP